VGPWSARTTSNGYLQRFKLLFSVGGGETHEGKLELICLRASRGGAVGADPEA
jgi:hypothetical protein